MHCWGNCNPLIFYSTRYFLGISAFRHIGRIIVPAFSESCHPVLVDMGSEE